MTNQKTNDLSHQGWEDYYVNATNAAWKEQPEEFLTENIASIAPVSKNLAVLDIACGDGRNTFIWSEDNNVVCCNDISETALRKIQQAEVANKPVLFSGDFVKLDLLSNQFDVIQCFDGLPQMPDIPAAINKMVELAKPEGRIIFNMFTPNDAAYGEGKQLSKNAFVYKDTLFTFFTLQEVLSMIPGNIIVEKHETRRWQDPPHGDFRPYPHTHEAIFFILKKQK